MCFFPRFERHRSEEAKRIDELIADKVNSTDKTDVTCFGVPMKFVRINDKLFDHKVEFFVRCFCIPDNQSWMWKEVYEKYALNGLDKAGSRFLITRHLRENGELSKTQLSDIDFDEFRDKSKFGFDDNAHKYIDDTTPLGRSLKTMVYLLSEENMNREINGLYLFLKNNIEKSSYDNFNSIMLSSNASMLFNDLYVFAEKVHNNKFSPSDREIIIDTVDKTGMWSKDLKKKVLPLIKKFYEHIESVITSVEREDMESHTLLLTGFFDNRWRECRRDIFGERW